MKPNLTARIDTPVGRFIVNRMHELGLEWVSLAAKCDLSVEGIKRICIPSNKTTIESLEKLAAALEIDAKVLIGLRDPNPSEAATPEVPQRLQSQSQRILSVWEAYLQIAHQVISSDLPQEVKPSTADIATMAYHIATTSHP